MILKLTEKQKDFLFKVALKNFPNLLELIKQHCSVSFNNYMINIDEDSANEISEICEDILAKQGFDENWEPNEIGKLAEELIDIIYKEFEN